MNKPYIHTTSFAFLDSKMGLTTLLAQLASNSRAKLWKVVMKCKNCYVFLAFGTFFSKCTFLRS